MNLDVILASDAAAISVAVIGAVGVVVAAWLPMRRTRKDLQRRVGEPNGHGSLVEMVTSLIVGQEHIKQRVEATEEKLDAHTVQDAENFAELRQAIEPNGING